MNNIIEINLNGLDLASGSPRSVQDEIMFKGQRDLELKFIGGKDIYSQAINITIDWGDGSERETYTRDAVYRYSQRSIFTEMLFCAIGGSPITDSKHTYDLSSNVSFTRYTIQVLIEADTGNSLTVIQPIIMSGVSYHDDIKELKINTTSIHDDSLLTMVNFQSSYNNRTWVAWLRGTEPYDFDCSACAYNLNLILNGHLFNDIIFNEGNSFDYSQCGVCKNNLFRSGLTTFTDSFANTDTGLKLDFQAFTPFDPPTGIEKCGLRESLEAEQI